ncbi:hypothetical protein BS47DRAFT_229425 [Hydnum rufescens UP504]|uniref:Uncharacterized protein n=1 Tax=Hydnum rufescens UP504 TaxID=1448309 RepID=A0A9P6B6M4_9AGAM|nr:hypothetical protein BS47DRAFT_229425 [Hydnum rufescens UP504]
MEDLALAFFDSPRYIHRSTQTSPASRSQNIPVFAPLDSKFREDQPSAPCPEPNMRPDASTLETHNNSNVQGVSSDSVIVSPLNGMEANAPHVSPIVSDTPSSTSLTGNTSKPLTGAFQSSTKSKPFIPRSYGGSLAPLAAGPVFPSTMVHPVKALPVASRDIPLNRAVSLPTRRVPGMDAALGHSADALTPHGNRIVSLPESTMFLNKLTVSSIPPSHHPGADDMPLLIDLSSPQPQHIVLSPDQSSPNGSILIHSSFVKSSSRSPSPSSAHDCSQSESESDHIC